MAPEVTGRGRLASVDLLRGVVMVVMALDHTRDFFTSARFEPTDLAKTTPAYFFTRFVTHFCAPVFVLLAGASASLAASRGKPKAELSRFLLARGLFLVLLELTIVRVAWFFDFDFHVLLGQVIWAIGWSMIVLGVLVHLPRGAIGAFGLGMVAIHNAFDRVRPEQLGALGWLWKVLHVPKPIDTGSVQLVPYYPLVPWIGVMAAGYAMGPVLALDDAAGRRRWLRIAGVALTAGFVVLRLSNLYGNPEPWSRQKDGVFTFMSFLNCEKYPPSLLFLAMTLGPAMLALAALDGRDPWLLRPFVTFGRVPLFYYVIHLYLLHAAALAFAYTRYGPAIRNMSQNNLPPGYGYPLPVVYAIWAGAVALLYPACAWYARVKQRTASPMLSYL